MPQVGGREATAGSKPVSSIRALKLRLHQICIRILKLCRYYSRRLHSSRAHSVLQIPDQIESLCDAQSLLSSRRRNDHMSFAETVPAALPAREFSLPFKLAIAFVLTALADWLFYDQIIGLSAVIFAIALIGGAVIANLAHLDRRRIWLAGLILLAGLAPVVEEVNALSLIFLFLALGLSLSRATNPDLDSPGRFALALRDLFLIGPFRFFRDAIGVFSLPGFISSIAVWLVPLGLGVIFVLLLGTANPVIERWIILKSPANTASPVDVEPSLFWIAATMFVWPFIQIWWRRKPAPASVESRLQALEPATRPSRFWAQPRSCAPCSCLI
jgi:hypothetical protein